MHIWSLIYCGFTFTFLRQQSAAAASSTALSAIRELNASSNAPRAIFLEALWDSEYPNQMDAAVLAGESVTFVCRIWKMQSGNSSASITQSENTSEMLQQSIFLYCPLSIAYCAQDCLLVEKTWPIHCTKQHRRFLEYQMLSSTIKLPSSSGWELHEIIYKLSIAFVSSSGSWSCSYSGFHSSSITLHVRDRPVLLSLTSDPKSPVVAGTAVNFTCQAAPSPNAPWYTFVWRRAGNQFPTAHSTVRVADTVSVLTLLSAQPSDDGEYSCHVTQDVEALSHGDWKVYENTVTFDDGTAMDGSLSKAQRIRKSPAILYTKLDVYHAPKFLQFSTEPIGPNRAGTTVTLVCHIFGGNPLPTIQFYRIPRGAKDVDRRAPDVQYFNHTSAQNAVDVNVTLARIQLVVRETDNGVRFGCAASGVVIAGQMLSPAVKLAVTFPPGPPILTAMPLNALSENRTRIFTCRSSRGSNPVASVHWKLLTSVDYITSIPVSNISVPINRRTLDSLLSGTNEDHTFNPGEIADFDSKLMESQSKVDPSNYGLIAFSEATLVSRPWYNGARVSCQLIWSPKENRNLTAVHTNKTPSSQTEYSKSVYLITEVIFAPTAVSLSAIPRNGIQENSGQQLLECITTSAIPAAQITWYRRKPAYNLGPTSSTTSTMHLQQATAEDPLQLTKEDILIQNGVTMEKLPGLYGGKRVVSRLHLSNISRIDDGVVYICKVTHVEWIRSIGRLHQLAVLFPPSLSIEITPSNWKRRIGSSVTLLHCIADGGRPKFPDHLEEYLSEVPSPQRQQLSLRKVHGQDRNLPVLDTHDDWKFTWFFRPSYPKQPVSASVLINNNSLQNFASVGDMVRTSDKNPSLLIIRNPEKSNAGAYTCRLDGPGGMVFKTTLVTFAFPPELVPSGATVFTAPTGFRAVLELHVWAFPHPLINTPMLEGYRTPRRENFCEIRQNASNHRSTSLNYTWFKVITTGSWPNVQITSRKQLTASDRQYTQSDTMPQQERIWSDVVLVNLATAQSRLLDTMVYRPQSGFMASENEMKIPTLVYRLFFPTVTAEDHGEYLCEVEHMLGKKAFLVKLQPPVLQNAATRSARFTRNGLNFKVDFDPKSILGIPEVHGLFLSRTKNAVRKESSSSAKREANSGEINTTEIAWVLIRICATSESSHAFGVNLEPTKYCAEYQEVSSWPASLRFPCLDQIIEKPESGSILIPFTENYNFGTSSKNITLYDEFGRSTETNVTNLQSDPPKQNGMLFESTSPSLNWNSITNVVYQFRLYNLHGSLLQATEWFQEDPATTPVTSKTSSKLGFYILLGSIILIAGTALTAVSTYICYRRRYRIKVINQVNAPEISHGCLFANNLMETTEEFFRQIHQQRLQHPGCPLPQESFYVANKSVIDSPCPFYRRMENHLQGAFLMPISPSLSTPNTGTFSTMASGQLLKNHFTKDCIREVKPAVNSAVYNGPSIKQNPSSEYSRVTATAPSNFPLNLTCLHRESDRDLNKKKYYTNILENKVAENEAGICESSLETSSEICLPSMPRNFENFNTDSLQIYNPCYDKRDESGASHLNYCKQLLLNDAAISQYCGALRRTSNKKSSPASLFLPTRTNESSKCIHNVRHVPVSPKPLTVKCGISERTDVSSASIPAMINLSPTIDPSNIEHLKICNDSNAQYTNNATKEKKASKLRTAMSSQRIVSENNELRKMDCKDAVKFDLLHSEKEKVPMLQQRMQKTAFSQTIHRPAGIIEGVLLHAHPVESLKHAASKETNQKLESIRLLSVVSQNDNHKASGNGMDT